MPTQFWNLQHEGELNGLDTKMPAKVGRINFSNFRTPKGSVIGPMILPGNSEGEGEYGWS